MIDTLENLIASDVIGMVEHPSDNDFLFQQLLKFFERERAELDNFNCYLLV